MNRKVNMFCTYCGKKISKNELFCPQCGKRLGTDTEEARLKQEEKTESPASINKSCGAQKAKYGFAKTLIITTGSVAATLFGFMFISDFKSGALLDHAAEKNKVNRIHRLIAMGQDVNKTNWALFGAARFDSKDAAKLLIESGADVNAKPYDGRTVLMEAVDRNNADFARLLIESGADVNAKDNDGTTALMMAAGKNAYNIAKLLIESGADVNAMNNLGRTALMRTAYMSYGNSVDLAKLLIKSGANVNAKDNAGETALSIAKSKGADAIVKALRAAGAR